MDTPLSSTDFTGAELFTSLRYDPLLESDYAIPAEPVALADRKGSPFYMLDYHYERILEAAEFLQWTTVREVLPDTAAFKIKLLDDMRTHMIDQKPQKIRFAINSYGNFSLSYMALPPVSKETLFPSRFTFGVAMERSQDITKVFIDNKSSPTGPATTFKTNKRHVYDSARARFDEKLPLGLGGEVLIVNDKGEILEGTLTSVYFYRNGRFVTPPVVAGPNDWKGQKGTTRRWALEKGLCVEEAVMKDSVSEGEKVWLSNGARGFWVGQVVSSD